MKKIVLSAVVAAIVTLGVYFGAVGLGLAPKNAAIVTLAASLVTVVATATTTATAAFVATVAFAAAFAAFAAFAAAFVAFAAAFVAFAAAFVAFAAAEKEKVAYWKVLLVYLVEVVSIAVPIYLHLHSVG